MPAWHASLAAVLVTGSVENGDVVLDGCSAGQARGYVENRLGAHTGDRGAADVFESERKRATVVAYALLFGSEERRPASVVLDGGRAQSSRPRVSIDESGRRTARESR